jgi:DNA-binding CsgD family transcriptional regulator
MRAAVLRNPSAASAVHSQHDILSMISEGLTNKRIARTLNVSPEIVKSHIKRIIFKLAVSTRVEAVSRAGSLGLF